MVTFELGRTDQKRVLEDFVTAPLEALLRLRQQHLSRSLLGRRYQTQVTLLGKLLPSREACARMERVRRSAA